MIELSNGNIHPGHQGRIFWLGLHGRRDDVIATACEDGSIGVWFVGSSENNDSFIQPKAHDEEALRVAWDREGSDLLFSGGSDGCVRLWSFCDDSGSLKLEQLVKIDCREDDDGQVYSLIQAGDTAPGFSLLGVAADNFISILDVQDELRSLINWRYYPHSEGIDPLGGARNPGNKAFVFDTSMHNTSCIVAALSDGSIRTRDIRNPLRDASSIVAHDSCAVSVATMDNSFIVASASRDGKCRLFDCRNWKTLLDYSLGCSVLGSSFWPGQSCSSRKLLYYWSASGDMFFADEHRIQKFNPPVPSGESGLVYPIYCAAVSRTASTLFICGGETPSHLENSCDKEYQSCGNASNQNPWLSFKLDPLEEVRVL